MSGTPSFVVMTRAALEHLLRAAAAITNEREFVVIGSQAVLVDPIILADRLRHLPLPAERIEMTQARLRRLRAP